jgi:hypothetical protein
LALALKEVTMELVKKLNKSSKNKFVPIAYVDDKVASAIGVIMEFMIDQFKGVREGQDMMIENQERFDFETQKNFKNIDMRLSRVEIKLTDLEVKKSL